MQRRICLLLMFLLTGMRIWGQEEPIFAFVLNQEGKAGLKPASSYKYDVALTVFNKLLRARGDARQQAPVLVMNNGERYVAWMDPSRVRIGLEEKAYDICTQMGKDSLPALAALLSHELIHYFEKHDWSRNFAHSHATLEAARQIGSLDEGIKQETQSDLIGGFLAFSAGYNVYDIMPRLLERIYRAYGLPEALPGYPGLSERVEVSRSAMARLKELQTVYEMAANLAILEKHEAAARYYRYILQDFQSREVYNNAGANLAIAALSYFNAVEMPYVLPMEIDPHSRLYNLKNVQSERIRMRTALLDQALELVDRAMVLDPDYAPAYINKACIYVLTGASDDAAFWLQKGKKLKDTLLVADFMVLEGIIAGVEKDSLRAEALFIEAMEKGNSLARMNLDAHRWNFRTPASDGPGSFTRESIDNLNLDDFLRSPVVEKEIYLDAKTICGVKTMPQSKVWVHYANDGKEYAVVHWNNDAATNSTQKGIRQGSNAKEVREIFGVPTRIIARTGRSIWVYAALGLLFEMEETGAVSKWGVFRTSG